jgi:hypothetical protein
MDKVAWANNLIEKLYAVVNSGDGALIHEARTIIALLKNSLLLLARYTDLNFDTTITEGSLQRLIYRAEIFLKSIAGGR